jgi:outer membrane protein assembly factor BamB
MKPIIHQDIVVHSQLFYVDGYEYLKGLNAKTGATIWSWNPLWAGETYSRNAKLSKDNYLALTHWGPLYSIDINTGINFWALNNSTDYTNGSPQIALINDYIYEAHNAKGTINPASYMTRADIRTGKFDTLFVKHMDNEYSTRLYPPSLWISETGDSVLIIQNRQWNFPASDGRIDLVAFNLKTRNIVWEVKDFDSIGNSNVVPPLIYDNKIYFQAQKNLYCFDAKTGNILWNWSVPKNYDDLLHANLIIAEGLLFVKPNNETNLYGINPNTGQVSKAFIDVGTGQGTMEYYNGIIYYSSAGTGKLFAIRISTGEIIWHHDSPNETLPGKWKGKTTFDDITVSPEHGCVFLSDHFFFMAIKLPE